MQSEDVFEIEASKFTGCAVGFATLVRLLETTSWESHIAMSRQLKPCLRLRFAPPFTTLEYCPDLRLPDLASRCKLCIPRQNALKLIPTEIIKVDLRRAKIRLAPFDP